MAPSRLCSVPPEAESHVWTELAEDTVSFEADRGSLLTEASDTQQAG